MDIEGELRLLRPKRGDVLALYIDLFALEDAEGLSRVLGDLRRDGVVVVLLPNDAASMQIPGRTVRELLDDWVRPHGFMVVPR
jgi:hypothetical protein